LPGTPSVLLLGLGQAKHGPNVPNMLFMVSMLHAEPHAVAPMFKLAQVLPLVQEHALHVWAAYPVEEK